MTYDLSRRLYSKMIREDSDEMKRSHWTELEIRGPIRNLSPELWTFTHLTALFLNDNNLQVSVCVLPPSLPSSLSPLNFPPSLLPPSFPVSWPPSLLISLLFFFSLPPLSLSLSFPRFQPPFLRASVCHLLVHILRRATTRKPHYLHIHELNSCCLLCEMRCIVNGL